jgi:nicotinamide-nucleotide amidase
MKKIALLNTGDEVVSGDIINLNSQSISKQLSDSGFFVNMTISVRDHDNDMESSLRFLLNDHDCIITTGGLGPTSDDRTRYAVSTVTDHELIFDPDSWEHIVTRIRARQDKDTPIPASNRQQAMFPKNATVIINEHGTANACYLQHKSKLIFMLPGPPRECMPLIASHVIPALTNNNYASALIRKSWYLFAASEGVIAEALDVAVKPYHCQTGYRATFPYIECKLFSSNVNEMNKAEKAISSIIAPYLIGDGSRTASEALLDSTNRLHHISINDSATGGKLQNMLMSPEHRESFSFNTKEHSSLHLTITGLDHYWAQQDDELWTGVQLKLLVEGKLTQETIAIPMRKGLTPLYAVEHICRFLLDHL